MHKKIIFRADGNATTGLGHLYRLFALVEIYKEQFDFVFLTKETSVLNIIPSDYVLKIIPERIQITDEPHWLSECFSSKEYIIIADGYQFNSAYQKKIKENGYFLVYIDDLATEYMYADIVVNHSPNVKKDAYAKEPYTYFALGTDYAILRPAFLESVKQEKKVTNIDTVFVCYGGADHYDFTYKTVSSLLKSKQIKKINVVVGGAYNHLEIYQLAEQNHNIKVYKNLNETTLKKVMESSNIGFVSASTVLYEIMTIKMPVFTGYFVQNQIDFYHGIQKSDVFFGLGDLCSFSFNTIPKRIKELTVQEIETQMTNQKSIIDGEQKSRFLALL